MTLPALRPSIGAGGLLVALYTLSDFGAVSLMQYDALTRSIYLQYRALFDRDAGRDAVARARRADGGGARARGALAPARLLPLGPAARGTPERVALGPLALARRSLSAAASSALFLLVPVAVLVYWSARAARRARRPRLAAGAQLDARVRARRRVAVVAVLAGRDAAAALPGAAGRALLERLSYSANALPGIVIALALVFFGARYGGFLYQTLALLVFAYVVRFFPQALAGVGSALQRVSPRLEEAARGLGLGPWRTLTTVTVPLVRSGFGAGAALVFLSAMKELPATLLLRPIGFDTLATEIWKFTQLGAYSRAAPAALLLIVVSAPFVYLLRRGAGRSSERQGRLRRWRTGIRSTSTWRRSTSSPSRSASIARGRRARRRSPRVWPRCSASRARRPARCSSGSRPRD